MSKQILSLNGFLIVVVLICACTSAKVTSPIYIPVSTQTATSIDTFTTAFLSTSSATSLPVATKTVTPFPIKTDTAAPLPTSTLVNTNTPIPILPIITEWYTYTHSSGVSIQYPVGWETSVYSYTDSAAIYFKLANALDISPFYQILLDVYDRPVNSRETADPHTWPWGVDGSALQWEKQIMVDNTPGIIFVWGSYRFDDENQKGEWDSMPSLYGIIVTHQSIVDNLTN